MNLKRKLRREKVYDVSEFLEISGRSSFGYFKNKSNQIFDILKITGQRGLRQLSVETELKPYLNQFTRELRHCNFGMTYIVMDSFVDFTPQLNYYRHRMKKVENEAQRSWLQYEIDRLTQYQGVISEERYYVIIFASNEKELLEAKSYILRSQYMKVSELEDKEKIDLLFKLNNLNS